MSNSDNNLKTTDLFYQAAEAIWQGYHSHPFIRGIADGSLSLDRFRFFMLQDYVYLYDYAKVFALGVVKATEPALICEFAANVNQILNHEMSIHRSYMARLGISVETADSTEPSLLNKSYTSYMLAEAYRGGPAEVLTTILACSWSYQEIGCRLAEIPGVLDNEFLGEWVEGYSSEQYCAVNQKLIDLMNKLTEGYCEKQLAELTTIFVNCSRYEAGFWDMCWNMEL